MFRLVAFCICFMTQNLLAATIGVIDSGTDIKHKDLSEFIWVNPVEIDNNNRDEDRNGYQDDINGWNFAENNKNLIDYKYLGTFSADVYKFFELQFLAMLGTATPEQMDWLRSKVQEEAFIKEVSVFGNFVHGTHVAGISVNGLTQSKVISVKLIPTEVNLPKSEEASANKILGFGMTVVKKALSELAKTQMTTMVVISSYLKGHKADVVNGSFGTGYSQAAMIAGYVFKGVFWREAKQEELHEATMHFMGALLEEGKRMLQEAPDTLFVFAAGNDGSDNDDFPISPANIVGENRISVAATYQRQVLASFSNYGVEMVDVAAPGMGINSTIPGDEYIVISGTSQAAPYVTRVAAGIKEINPALKPAEIRKILMGTVDKKTFLAGKVKSGGMINDVRALEAAKFSLSNSVEEAIRLSLVSVLDLPVDKGLAKENLFLDFVLPLPSVFKF
ncbi:MAG: hypothetical protein A2381_08460 [Bdellovibrionales bacterium RIFOXYB1_FULL_37_110]|nr:MAG: hypothetical protein A2417_14135 [Bdellovibrionales bacterium RIFOXYC1_FULL_37_79]OFZ58238.1 MAG: hypothetical protein A2381_08460 [Bdellovibrionales bacterium RIFOXYB1_FULL_37_110]OFZ62289.1 MAG: hypothetical protein A2577_17075 [Bdellovibrionales bacterium RIFOXYD1_FULL_36_51]